MRHVKKWTGNRAYLDLLVTGSADESVLALVEERVDRSAVIV